MIAKLTASVLQRSSPSGAETLDLSSKPRCHFSLSPDYYAEVCLSEKRLLLKHLREAKSGKATIK